MLARILTLLVLLAACLSLGCSPRRTVAVQPPSGSSPENHPTAVAEENPTADVTEREDVVAVAEVNVPAAQENGGEINVEAAPEPEDGPNLVETNPPPEKTEEIESLADVDDADFEIKENGEGGQGFLDSALDFVNSSQDYWSEGNPDRALAILDDAFSLVLKVDTEKNPELFQQKEDLRYMISKRILEIYASRYTATSGNHNEIPLTLNSYVEKEIKRFQGPEHKFFEESYRRSGKYMPMILASLKEAGLPEELAWVPLIESGFKVDALSKARALGLWQFMASTGQKFGLKRDTWVDQRMDPEKSTAAAIAYLKELHNIFGDWTTVLAGYNCGEGRVLQKIRSQKINYLDNFWDLFQMLPYETALYVPKFLAALHILKDPAKYGFDLGTPDSAIPYETVTIQKPVQLKAVADAIGATENELNTLNPELRYKATPSGTYALRVPEGKTDLLLAKIDTIPKYTPPENTYVNHSVRKGETLSDIAVQYHTTVSRIVLANNLRSRNFIRIGQKLKVPLRGATVSAAQPAPAEELLPGGKYRVRKGDSLWIIARKFNTNTKKIQQVNGLKDTLLQVGQILIIPE